jgi:hypothetical protein
MGTNSGNRNSGYYNSGDYNSGYRNSGYRNSGDYNSGNRNSGDYNSGNRNSGYYNSGNYNSGYYNSGNYNSGDYNSGYYNSGVLNSDTPKIRMFNQESEWEFGSNQYHELLSKINNYQKPLCEWVSSVNMSDEEKKNNPSYETTGGYLKVNDSTFKGVVSEEDKVYFRSLPNFDEDIFKECTGIDLKDTKVKMIMDGKEIWISQESYEQFKKQFCK